MRNGGRSLGAENPEVIELSELLQRMTLHSREVSDPTSAIPME
jgi:hypothetical protein